MYRYKVTITYTNTITTTTRNNTGNITRNTTRIKTFLHEHVTFLRARTREGARQQIEVQKQSMRWTYECGRCGEVKNRSNLVSRNVVRSGRREEVRNRLAYMRETPESVEKQNQKQDQRREQRIRLWKHRLTKKNPLKKRRSIALKYFKQDKISDQNIKCFPVTFLFFI